MLHRTSIGIGPQVGHVQGPGNRYAPVLIYLLSQHQVQTTDLNSRVSTSACHMYVMHADTVVLHVLLLRWLHGLSTYSSSAILLGLHSAA